VIHAAPAGEGEASGPAGGRPTGGMAMIIEAPIEVAERTGPTAPLL
jgi:hypothetical protein